MEVVVLIVEGVRLDVVVLVVTGLGRRRKQGFL